MSVTWIYRISGYAGLKGDKTIQLRKYRLIVNLMSVVFYGLYKKMINKDKAIEGLISTTPELKKKWNQYIAKEYGENYQDERKDLFGPAVISEFIIEKYQQGGSHSLEVLFSKVEEVYIQGDQQTEELIIIGLIEGLQNICGWREIDYYNVFNNYFHAKTYKAWMEVIEFWEGQT